MPRADASPPFSQVLRDRTAAAHRVMEDRLDLLRPPLSRARFRATLLGFWAFHQGWEPALAASGAAGLEGFRSRLPLIRLDLLALGAPAAALAAVAPFAGAAALVSDPGRASGSLYVVEGSALGGRIIGRAVGAAPWAPSGGLRTFDPYGAETGARWRAVRAGLDAQPPGRQGGAVAGAQAAFAALQGCVAERLDLEELDA